MNKPWRSEPYGGGKRYKRYRAKPCPACAFLFLYMGNEETFQVRF
jgi:hypothetical protein